MKKIAMVRAAFINAFSRVTASSESIHIYDK